MGELDADNKRLLLHVLDTCRKGGLAPGIADTLAAAVTAIESTEPVEVKDWPCIIEGGAQLGSFSDICYAMREWADEEGVPVRFSHLLNVSDSGGEFVIAPGEDMTEFLWQAEQRNR